MATPEQIRGWLQANPGASDAQIFQAMQQHGVTPDQLAAVTGGNVQGIQQRYNAQAGGQPSAMNIPTGLYGSEQALGAGYESALGSLLAGIGQGRHDVERYGDMASSQIRDGFNRAEGYMSPYAQQGKQVNPLLMALTGASGQEAFDKAFTESPVQQFLQERGNRAIAANAAATGGLGGANVQKEFMRYNQGLAGQALQDQINNLMGLSNQGFAGATNAANFAGQGGQALAGVSQNTGQSLANMALTGGLNAGQYAMNTGQNVAAGRSQAGRDLAASIAQTSGNLSNIAMNQGNQASGIYDTISGNLANLLASSGTNQADILRWLAGAQATAAQNASSQYAGTPNTAMMPTNNLQSVAQLLGGAGTLLGAL